MIILIYVVGYFVSYYTMRKVLRGSGITYDYISVLFVGAMSLLSWFGLIFAGIMWLQENKEPPKWL